MHVEQIYGLLFLLVENLQIYPYVRTLGQATVLMWSEMRGLILLMFLRPRSVAAGIRTPNLPLALTHCATAAVKSVLNKKLNQ